MAFSLFPPAGTSGTRWGTTARGIVMVLSGGLASTLVLKSCDWLEAREKSAGELSTLTVRVSELTSAVNELAREQKDTREEVANIRGRLEPVANLRSTMAEADSHLAQRPRPDVAGARQVLAEATE